tara:strand:- start:6082 stop:7968 length:1887 start_codon:yes stop_codon:yes gene_type:complete
MNKFNENQQKIIREEVKRAFIVKSARKQLSEAEFNDFYAILEDYEANSPLLEGDSADSEELYEGLFDRLQNLGRGIVRKLAPNDQEAIEDFANRIEAAFGTAEAYKEMGYEASREAEKAKMRQLLAQMAKVNPEAARGTAEAYGVPHGSDASGGGAGGSGGSAGAGAPSTGDPKADAQAIGRGLDNPKAQGAWAAWWRTMKMSLRTNEQAWQKINDIMNGIGTMPPGEQAAAVEKAQDQVEDQIGGGEEGEEGETEEAKPLRVRSIQRPIISVIQKVLAAQGVDIKLADAQKLAIQITNNLVDQMKTNDVVFKEALGSEIAKVLKEERLVFLPRAKLTNKMINVHNTGKRALNQVELNPEEQEEESKGYYNYKLAVKDPKIWLVLSKDWIISRIQKGYGKKENLSAAMENDDNFLDVWDMFKDLMEIKKMYRSVAPKAKATPEVADAMKKMFAKLRNQARIFSSAQGVGWTWSGGGGWKEASKRALELKKAAKGSSGGDLSGAAEDAIAKIKSGNIADEDVQKTIRAAKIDPKSGEEKILNDLQKLVKSGAKDLSVGSPTKGQINISKVVGKTIQSHGGLDAETASKLTPILKKKIEKIIARHMGADVKYLEEKINRYVIAVIKELKV